MRGSVVQANPASHRIARSLVLGLLSLLPVVPQAASLYLCKAYSGGSFWSAQPCQGQQALVDRIVTVPDGLTFKEQVRLGEQARTEADRLRQGETGGGKTGPQARHKLVHHADQPGKKQAGCATFEAKIDKLDAQARQAQTAKAQDKIAAQKRRLREQQSELHC